MKGFLSESDGKPTAPKRSAPIPKAPSPESRSEPHSKIKPTAPTFSTSDARQRVFLVDGSGYIFRAFYAVPALTTKEGFPTNALFGFTKMLLKLLSESSSYVAVVFDTGAETFRDKLYPEYKANRAECPSELIEQMPYFRTIARALGLPVLELPGFEADDVIGTLAHRLTDEGSEVVIVTADKDLMQLVGEQVSIWDTMKDRWISEKEVIEKFGVPPVQVVDVLGLVGDSSDNIPGVEGIGPKTAAQLIEKYGSLEGIIGSLKQIQEDSSIRNRKKIVEQIELNVESARLSRKLAQIDTSAPITLEHAGRVLNVQKGECSELYDTLQRGAPDTEELKRLVDRLEFSSLLGEFARGGGAAKAKNAAVAVVTADDFTEFVKRLSAQPEFTFDTETTSLNFIEAQVIGVSFAWGAQDIYYVPLSHRVGEVSSDTLVQVPVEQFVGALKPIFESEQIKKSGQHLKYDINVLARLGIAVRGVTFDSLIAAYVLNPDRSTYNLTALSEDYLNRQVIEYEQALDGAPDLSYVPIARAAEYAGLDAELSWLLKETLQPKLSAEHLGRVFNEIEMPLVPILAAMEQRGVKLDTELLSKMSAQLGGELDKIRAKLFEQAGCEFNMNSPKQLAEILFTRLGISTRGIKKTKTGFSTDSSVLEKLRHAHPFAELMLQHRMLHKLKSTYVDALPEQVSAITGRLHSKFNQTATGTGRLSSSDPNLQNIPIQTAEGRRIRSAFIAEPGNVLLSADYSQIELRLLAHMSEDSNLIDAFVHGVDIHAKTAREIAGLSPEEQVSPEQRRVGKTINFGVIYGMGSYRLSQELEIPIPVAQGYIDSYFDRYPGVKRFFAKIEQDAVQKGVVTTMFGRRRVLSDLDTTGRDKGFILRAAINAPIQGTAADIIKLAMIRIAARLKEERVPCEMLLQIHDELVFECARSAAERARELIRGEMESVVPLRVPLEVAVGVGANWQEAHQ